MKFVEKVVILAFILLLIPTVYSQTQFFDIKLDCIDGCQSGTVETSKPIMLKLEIRNNFDYWVALGRKDYSGPSFRMTIRNPNLQGSWTQQSGIKEELYGAISGKVLYLKPKHTEFIYIPFEIYNTLEQDKRLGQWEIEYELDTNGVNYYENPYTGKEIQRTPQPPIPTTIKGNILRFESKKPEVVIDQPKNMSRSISSTLKKWFTEQPYAYFSWIIGSIIIGVIIYLIKRALR